MSAERPQNFANHPHLPTWFIAQGVLGLLTFGVLGWVLFKYSDDTSVFLLAVAVAVLNINMVTVFLHLRFTALKLQDRLIRLETRTRLYRVLPQDLHGQIEGLSLGQLVSLRFGSDAELEGLVRQVLRDNISERAAIKKLVKDWQPDWMRV